MKHDTAIDLLRQRETGSSRVPITAWAEHRNNAPGENRPLSLYIHIPFCFHKCHYCDFYSIVDTQDRQERFAARLTQELAVIGRATDHPRLSSVFIGGGTPTLLRPDLLSDVLNEVERAFEIRDDAERTIEVNPETMSDEIADVLGASKVNRVSIGAQSFNPRHLKTLERHHDPESVARALDRARDRGIERRSVDLIYAIPTQTHDEWVSDLKTALDLPIDHISAYALTYEPNTAMTARLKRGEFDKAPDELEVEMYNTTLELVRSQGFDRYEVSNHARPGAECAHNLAYWRFNDWIAAGPSASGHLGGHLWKNTPRLDTYLNHDDEGFAPMIEHEPPDPRRELMDRLMLSVRIREGLDASETIKHAEGLGCGESLRTAVAGCADQGWLRVDDARWTLTDEGFHFADRVASELIGALSER